MILNIKSSLSPDYENVGNAKRSYFLYVEKGKTHLKIFRHQMINQIEIKYKKKIRGKRKHHKSLKSMGQYVKIFMKIISINT